MNKNYCVYEHIFPNGKKYIGISCDVEKRWSYVNEIIKRFKELGYEVQLFKLNAAKMNVPQARERVFFIANNQNYPKLKLNFNEKPILFGECRSKHGILINPNLKTHEYLKHLKATDKSIRGCDKKWLSDEDCRNISTFPQDYDFGKESAQYICGMSVPPNMMANIATEIYNQWLKGGLDGKTEN